MKKYSGVELYDPQWHLENIQSIIQYSEMTDFERRFLCGLIKEKRPDRILEIGVAAGATTAVILNCIAELGLDTELISVDYVKEYYRDSNKLTGFVAEEFKEKNEGEYCHKCYFGDYIPAFLEEICAKETDSIDFLILDTMHTMPGEVLDFLVCLPFLTDDAVVVLHDVGLNHTVTRDSNALSTKVLFDAVSAEKYYMFDENNPFGISNIAAFRVTEETRQNIIDIFSSLYITWQYQVGMEDLEKYRKIIDKFYDVHLVEFYDHIIGIQSDENTRLENDIRNHYNGGLQMLDEKWSREKNVYIYGAGYWGSRYFKYARSHSLPVRGIVVSDDQNIKNGQEFGVPIMHLSEIKDEENECTFILAVSRELMVFCISNLLECGFHRII